VLVKKYPGYGNAWTGAFGSGPSRAELIGAILPHKTAQMRTKLEVIAAAARPRAVLGRSGSGAAEESPSPRAAVSPLFALTGSPCLRHRVHGAPIGGDGGHPQPGGVAARGGGGQCGTPPWAGVPVHHAGVGGLGGCGLGVPFLTVGVIVCAHLGRLGGGRSLAPTPFLTVGVIVLTVGVIF
jgi:hypothetical protein